MILARTKTTNDIV